MIPLKLRERLNSLGIPEDIYNRRTRKCILSKEKLEMKNVQWYRHAYFIPEGFETDSIIFDPVSLVPCIALEPAKGDMILDMCAAPGTKTFILSFLTDNKAQIAANDIDMYRIKRLTANANKYNINCKILNMSGRKIEGSFNKILVDAPCSGEGMVNKKEKLFKHWSERRIRFLSKKQKKLISHAFEILEKGGTLVYGTCTFAPEENEGVVDFLLKKNENAVIEKVAVPITHTTGITSWLDNTFDERLKNCMRIYPQHNETGGFFVAKIRKV